MTQPTSTPTSSPKSGAAAGDDDELPISIEPDVELQDGGDADEPDDEVLVLPWWRNPINIVAIALAIAVLAGMGGWVVGNNRALPNPNDVDVGFLQDMRVHHEQAVQMSFIYLEDPGTDGDLRTIAREILVGQNIEIGRMIQLLRDYGEPEVSDSDLAMAWMNEPVDVDHALDPGGLRAGADRAGVGTATEEQPEGGHDHRLAGSGLTGDHGQTGPELQRRRLDHPERRDPDLLKHRSARRPPARGAGDARWTHASPRPGARTSPRAGR